MIDNQIRVLVQRVNMHKKTPWKVCLSKGLRWALEQECLGKSCYKKTDKGHFFEGLLLVVDESLTHPIVIVKPEFRNEPLPLAIKGNPYAVC